MAVVELVPRRHAPLLQQRVALAFGLFHGLAQDERAERGLVDRVDVAADVVAVLCEHLELVRELVVAGR